MVSISKRAGTYGYVNTDHCQIGTFNRSLSIHIKGRLSDDPQTPGLLHETAALFNHTLGHLDPNYIFRVDRNGSTGVALTVYTYACLGRLPPIVGRAAFSFNVLSRASHLSHASIETMVAVANRTSAAQLDLRGLRITDGDTFRQCGL